MMLRAMIAIMRSIRGSERKDIIYYFEVLVYKLILNA